jgi:hypothetical protein
MTRINIAGLLLIAALAAAAHGQVVPSTSSTYAVGNCKPNLPSFSTITAALAATPSPTIVDVCPGTYNEQIVITYPVTLQGVTSGNLGQAIVAVPNGGLLVANAVSPFGNLLIAPQLWVNGASGEVNVTDITFDATSGRALDAFIVGIFYQNTAGTVNRVTTRYQTGSLGVGIWIEGGASNPAVTVENSSVHDFDNTGILAETISSGSSSETTVTIKSNSVNPNVGGASGIVVDGGATATATGNWVFGAAFGILTGPDAAGSVSSNTIEGAFLGLVTNADAVSVSSNKILNSSSAGIAIETQLGAVKSNTIIGGANGMDFNCNANGNVSSNTIIDVGTGIANVPAAITSSNSYYNVGTIRSAGSCSKSR